MPEHTVANGWPWTDNPVYACHSRHNSIDAWHVTTNPDMPWAANVYVAIDAINGEVLASDFRKAVECAISLERALQIARDWVLSHGYDWDKVDAFEDEFYAEDGTRVNCWSVGNETGGKLGGNWTVSIDAESGEVLEGMFTSR